MTLKAQRVGSDTVLAQIIRMVESAQAARLPIQNLVDQVTRYFVPAVMGIALVTFLVWFFFGIGPGAVIGNWVFGNPNDPSTWLFGMPSIWTWQLLWWALGVFMMWFLAYKMEMSTVPEREVEALHEDIGDIHLDVDKP